MVCASREAEKIGSKLNVITSRHNCLWLSLTSFVGLSDLANQELNELIREAINEIRFFRIMYAAIWIPLFTLLIILSYVNYRLYKKQLSEASVESADGRPLVSLRKDLYELIAKKGEDVDSFVNKVVEESLKSN
jgi:hypothetical protein